MKPTTTDTLRDRIVAALTRAGHAATANELRQFHFTGWPKPEAAELQPGLDRLVAEGTAVRTEVDIGLRHERMMVFYKLAEEQK